MTRDPAPPAAPREGFPPGAWAVHLFTASGIVLALLALDAVIGGRDREALLWLFAALAVDGIDGSFARAARVKERLPRIDGEVLDLVIDYTTYVLIPALMIWRMGALPDALALPFTAVILVSSLYVFARRDMKTDDGYFRGFPALWNIVAFYFVVAPPEPALAAAIVAALVVLTFAPVHAVHPFRVRDYGALLPILAVVWAVATVALLWPGLDEAIAKPLLAVSLGSALLLLALGLWRSVRGPKRESNSPASKAQSR
jgi:phosphatidylcholine synthase